MSRLYQRKGFIKTVHFAVLFLGTLPVAFSLDLSATFATLYRLMLPGAILIGLALVAVNGYGILTSGGDPRKVQDAQEGLFSAIMGLVFVILAVVIYRVIVNSLLPGNWGSP